MQALTISVDLMKFNKSSLFQSCTNSSRKLRYLSIPMLDYQTQEMKEKVREFTSKMHHKRTNVISTKDFRSKFMLGLLILCWAAKSSKMDQPNTKQKTLIISSLQKKRENKQKNWLERSLAKPLVISIAKKSKKVANNSSPTRRRKPPEVTVAEAMVLEAQDMMVHTKTTRMYPFPLLKSLLLLLKKNLLIPLLMILLLLEEIIPRQSRLAVVEEKVLMAIMWTLLKLVDLMTLKLLQLLKLVLKVLERFYPNRPQIPTAKDGR